MSEMELNVLGAVFSDPSSFWIAAEVLKPEHFRDPRNTIVWETISHLAVSGLPFDHAAVRKELHERGKIDIVSEVHLRSCLDFMPDVANMGYYAGKIREEWIRFRAQQQATSLRADLDAGKNVKDVLDKHQAELVKLHGGLDHLEERYISASPLPRPCIGWIC